MTTTKELFTIAEVAAMAGIKRQAVDKRLARLGIVPQRLGRLRVVNAEQAQRLGFLRGSVA